MLLYNSALPVPLTTYQHCGMATHVTTSSVPAALHANNYYVPPPWSAPHEQVCKPEPVFSTSPLGQENLAAAGNNNHYNVELAKAIFDAHVSTSNLTVGARSLVQHTGSTLVAKSEYGAYDRVDWWKDCVHKLTDVVQQIIEFAKLVPGFLNLPQNDQIILLKEGVFNVVILRLSQLYCPDSGTVMYNGTSLATSLISQALPSHEAGYLAQLFLTVRQLRDLCLTEIEIALLSAFVMTSLDIECLIAKSDVSALHCSIHGALVSELQKRPQSESPGPGSTFARIMRILPELEVLSTEHRNLFRKFSEEYPIDIPELYKELFTIEL